MHTIKLSRRRWIDDIEEIEFNVKNKGSFKVNSVEEEQKRDSIYQISYDNDTKSIDLGFIHSPDSPSRYIINQMIKQDFLAEVSQDRYYNFTIDFIKCSAETSVILHRLQELSGIKSKLSFCSFKSSNESVIIVEFFGHEVGGSYVHDYEVAPDYVKDLQNETNRVVEWTGRRSGGIGSDIYEFKVFLDKVIDNDFIYKPKFIYLEEGKTYKANEDFICGGRWALAKDCVFEVYHNGHNYQDETKIRLLSGKAKTTVHSVFFKKATNEYSGGGPFLEISDLAEKLGVNDINELNISYDPYGGVKFPVQEC